MYIQEPPRIFSLLTAAAERDLARNVLSELNPAWENQFSRTFTEAITKVLPECELVQNKARVEKKRKHRAQKRKIVAHINAHCAQNATMSHLTEAESQASYSRKRLALSYERCTTPQRRKSHSPNENNMAWDMNAAILELQNFPPNEN